jgi:hypothetical protein
LARIARFAHEVETARVEELCRNAPEGRVVVDDEHSR